MAIDTETFVRGLEVLAKLGVPSGWNRGEGGHWYHDHEPQGEEWVRDLPPFAIHMIHGALAEACHERWWWLEPSSDGAAWAATKRISDFHVEDIDYGPTPVAAMIAALEAHT